MEHTCVRDNTVRETFDGLYVLVMSMIYRCDSYLKFVFKFKKGLTPFIAWKPGPVGVCTTLPAFIKSKACSQSYMETFKYQRITTGMKHSRYKLAQSPRPSNNKLERKG